MCATCRTYTISSQYVQHMANFLARFSTYQLSIDMYKIKVMSIKIQRSYFKRYYHNFNIKSLIFVQLYYKKNTFLFNLLIYF